MWVGKSAEGLTSKMEEMKFDVTKEKNEVVHNGDEFVWTYWSILHNFKAHTNEFKVGTKFTRTIHEKDVEITPSWDGETLVQVQSNGRTVSFDISEDGKTMTITISMKDKEGSTKLVFSKEE